MAWYLDVARAANLHALIPTPLTVAYGTDAYVLDFTVAYTDATTDQMILGSVSVTSVHAIYFTTSGRLQITVGGTNAYFTNGSFGLPDGDFHNYRIEHDSGGAWRAYRDGVLFQSGTYSGALTTTSPLNAIFKRSSTTTAGLSANLRFKHLEAIGFGAGSNKWDANLSGGVGSLLPTVNAANDATLVNFPTYDSEWVFYDAGGAVASTAAWSIGPLVWQSSAAVSPPTFTSATAWSVSPLVWQGSVAAAVPAYTSAASWSVSPLVWQGSADATAPGAINSTAAWSISPLVWQASAAAAVPTYASTAAWSITPLVWQGAADATAPGANVATVAWSIPPLVWQGSAAATVPTYTSAAAWSITPLVWRVSASVGGAPVFAAKGATITERLPSRAIIERLQTARITE